MDIKEKNTNDRNENDLLFLERLRNFRNLQRLDGSYLEHKERIMWPLFEYRAKPNLEVLKKKKGPNFNEQEILAEIEAKNIKNFGKASKKFSKLQSV